MLDKILQTIAPHYCCGCQKAGSLLCNSCIFNITEEYTNTCLSCGKLSNNGLCGGCQKRVAYQNSWVASPREAAVEELINLYKFSYAKAAATPLASLLDQTLPILPSSTVIVPIPTTGKHIRQRGYDHASLLAKTLASRRQLACKPLLRRANSAVQREAANARQREKQAAAAFKCSHKLDEATPYLIVDDVITTGATVRAAARCLKEAGAKKIFIAAVARNPLD